MHLKRLTVHGFKSFADKTHFDFESSLTGIVGPNGCGKSNVVDALKWVLGDQRARSLRGKEMTDVIFKGAEGREGSHHAEVVVELTDEDGAFDGRNEIAIGRRLTKDKESDYTLNGEVVRLKDVRDVLMDTGLGVGAYSVMEQGRIDAVLSANPEDRRAIFEEAAGISRFKLQKRETLRKLDRTEINLARVKDLLEERGKRIRSLKIQAGKARRYRELRAELRDLRTAVAVVSGKELRARHGEIDARLTALVAELARTEARARELEEVRNQLDERIEQRSQEHEAVLDEIRRVESRIDADRQQAVAHDHRAADQRAHAAESRLRRDGLEAQQAEKEQALRSARDRVAQLEEQAVALAKALEAQRAEAKASQAQARELHQKRETARQRVLEWMNDRTRARNAAHDARAQVKAQDARLSSLGQRQADLDASLLRLEAEAAAIAQEVRRGTVEAAHLAAEERLVLRELEAADGDAAELGRRESELRQQLSSVHGRLQVLRDMEAHMEGLDAGPRYLLQQRPDGLQGRLLDLLDVDVEFSAALEAALGPYVQALLVESRQHADAMHELLRRENKGRAILLVEREIPDDLLSERPLFEAPYGATSLASHIRYPGLARCLVHWLLRGVCLIEVLDHALPHRHDLCFVTRDGRLLCGPRVEGGSAEGRAGLIVRKATIQALTAEAVELEARLAELVSGRQRVAERVAGLKGEAGELAMLLQQARTHLHGREGHRDNLLERLVAGERDLETLALEADDIARQRTVARAELMTLLFRAFCLGRQESREGGREAEIATALVEAQRRAEELGRTLQQVELRQVACRSDREGARDACRMHEQALAELAENVAGLREREAKSLQAAADHDATAAGLRARADAAGGELAGQQQRREAAAAALGKAREEFTACKAEIAGIQDSRSATSATITDERLALGEVEHKFAWLETRLLEDVGIALRRCLGEVVGLGLCERSVSGPLPGPDDVQVEVLQGPPIPAEMLADELALTRLWERADFDAVASETETRLLQAKMERLGPVNLDSVEELEDEEAGFLRTEKEVKDLTESRTSLVEALRRMEEESRTLFEATFHAARENFQTIFRKLFQGGRADMFLTEDAGDALEAGIEIMARPPGKELQSINLLSGGERTLTALAILFAVFKVKPSPFCILDEVDAALDDTNVERFLRVLDDFVGPTQFCVVTHHKRTMAACNQLYGVTMQKRGVSSRIAVNLEEVDQLTATGLKGDTRGAEKQRIAGEEALGF